MRGFIAICYSLSMSILLFCLVEATFPKTPVSILMIAIFICIFILPTQVRMLNYDMEYALNDWFWKWV
ncbi:TMhelix containing protein [Vibrio phage 1.193.O._10N.286.52.C6]|nr:TMhelix containing protein [Vibrio phage 1.193.O._10N.286.52.C6]